MTEKYDFSRAASLLAIVKDVAGVAPQFTAISGEAMSELKELNDALLHQVRKNVKPTAKPLVNHPTPSVPVEHIKGTEDQQKRAEEEKRKAEEAEHEEERRLYEQSQPKVAQPRSDVNEEDEPREEDQRSFDLPSARRL